jgi:anti-sigma factor (TIGR02949 family)
MNVMKFNPKECERIRHHFDAYLSNELLVETTSEVLRHLETCAACTQELEARTRVRDALRKAAGAQVPPEELRQSIHRQIRKMQPGLLGGSLPLRMAVALAAIIVIVLAGVSIEQWAGFERGKRMVASVLEIGVADHVQCAIKGHNYPEVAKSPAQLRTQLGPRYAGLLEVVQQKLPGFEVLEAHVCSIPASPRKYVHFITRGRGTILSVILTHRDGEQLPHGVQFRSGASESVNLYEAHLEGMNAAGFESKEYWGFVVSDLSRDATLQIASELAPPLKAALDSGAGFEARANLETLPFVAEAPPSPGVSTFRSKERKRPRVRG